MDYTGVIIDWSCSDKKINDCICKKLEQKTGIKTVDVVYGGLPLLDILGKVFIETAEELSEKECEKDENKIQEKKGKEERRYE